MKPVKVGIIGCGNISGIYFKNTAQFEILDVIAAADLVPERVEAKAAEFNIPKVYYSGEELLQDPEVELIINLGTPDTHAEICLAALNAGKHVYVEKPLAITLEEGQAILRTAEAKGLLVGCAPDTFMGGGIQTCRKLIDDGWIGQPIGGTAFMVNHGHEHWHPDPEFYYKTGGGPMFDMGPYYLTALVNLLGPIKRICGSTKRSFAERTITSTPKYGQKIEVEVPTHVAGIFDFASGAVISMITSFDVWGANLPRIEIYGTKGTLSVPDPNGFGGPVKIKLPESEWKEIPLTHGYSENSRGLGAADLAYAIRTGRNYRASCKLAYHVLEAMHGVHSASDSGRYYEMESTCDQPEPLERGTIPFKEI
ncbi:MAG: Gfo/Idh/MocA family protein [Candidatus Wallacebacter cryptica]